MLVIVLLTEHKIIVINTHSYIEIGKFILSITIGVLVSQIPNMSKQLKRSSNQIAFNNVQLNLKRFNYGKSNKCLPYMPQLVDGTPNINTKSEFNLTLRDNSIKDEGLAALSKCLLPIKNTIQLIGEYLEEDVGHQAQFLVAGLYPSSVAAYGDYRGLSLAYNDIDVYIKYNKNMKSKTNQILSSNYDDESHLRNFIEVCYTSITGIDKPINIIVIDEKKKEELCLKTLIDKFDINAVQAGFVVKWSSILKRYYIDEWYRTVDYNKFLKSNILKISNISRLCKPANSII